MAAKHTSKPASKGKVLNATNHFILGYNGASCSSVALSIKSVTSFKGKDSFVFNIDMLPFFPIRSPRRLSTIKTTIISDLKYYAKLYYNTIKH